MENLRALVHGVKLNTYQRGLALQEFIKLEQDNIELNRLKGLIDIYEKTNWPISMPKSSTDTRPCTGGQQCLCYKCVREIITGS